MIHSNIVYCIIRSAASTAEKDEADFGDFSGNPVEIFLKK